MLKKEYDPVFPGENWFYYWKTSPSLWRNKLEQFSSGVPIFVPLFWGFHSEYEDTVDFGSIKPEANLKRLFDTANEVGKHIVFLAPIMPMPFLPNGGLPSYVARSVSHDENGMVVSIIDNESRLNKIYSFFEPKVFHAYKKFMWQLGQFFSENGISSHVYGCECYKNENGVSVSFLNDSSPAFDQGFARFVSQQSDEIEINSTNDEKKYKEEYISLITDLYLTCATESLAGNWSGSIKFTFLGAASSNVFSRSSDIWEFSGNYFKDINDIVTNDKMPSSVLLSFKTKEGVLNDALEEYISPSYIHRSMDYALYDDEIDSTFSPLFFYELHSFAKESILNKVAIEKNGFQSFLDRHFRSTYIFKEAVEQVEEDFVSSNKVHYFWGHNEDPDCLKDMIKLFLNGAKVIIDTSDFSHQVQKKLETFFLENNIQKESISYLTKVDYVSLGDGKIILFEGKTLNEHLNVKQIGFWERLIKFLSIKHLNIESDSDIVQLWKKRLASPIELDYEEIRRVSLYNPSSYKRRVKVITNKNFALLKIVGEKHVNVNTSPIGIDLEMLPGGGVSFDFGYFE